MLEYSDNSVVYDEMKKGNLKYGQVYKCGERILMVVDNRLDKHTLGVALIDLSNGEMTISHRDAEKVMQALKEQNAVKVETAITITLSN